MRPCVDVSSHSTDAQGFPSIFTVNKRANFNECVRKRMGGIEAIEAKVKFLLRNCLNIKYTHELEVFFWAQHYIKST